MMPRKTVVLSKCENCANSELAEKKKRALGPLKTFRCSDHQSSYNSLIELPRPFHYRYQTKSCTKKLAAEKDSSLGTL